MKITINHGEGSYDIIVGENLLGSAREYLNLNRKVLIVTDKGIPEKYISAIKDQCKECIIEKTEQGEKSKSIENYTHLLDVLCNNRFTRTDCIVTIGGGVVGDLSGFVASCYMRGIDFYNIPTTLLSMTDSSIGGKVAIDYNGYKNAVGTFYQPKRVLIDLDTLKTLSKRQFNSGLAEAVKMAVTMNEDLFSLLEKEDNIEKNIETVVVECLKIKKTVVEKDPKEKNLRRVLNFGHTIGHAIESLNEKSGILHGECVSIGMLPMCSDEVKSRLTKVLEKYSLPVRVNDEADSLMPYIYHDKKADGDEVNAVFCNKIGSFEFGKIKIDDMKKYVERIAK